MEDIKKAEDQHKLQFSLFLQNFKNISDQIKSFPIPDQLKAIICKHFDDGYLWTKEGFLSILAHQVAKPNAESLQVDELPQAG